MNYVENYYNLVDYARRQKRKKDGKEYYEEHHIIPRSLGGTNKKTNLVLFTPREHFLAHYLLYKFSHTKETLDSFATILKNPEYTDFIFSIKMYEEVLDKQKAFRPAPKNNFINKRGSKFDPIF